MKIIVVVIGTLLLLVSNISADDVSIDHVGNIKTGVSNTSANFQVTGSSGEDAIFGTTSGTTSAGVYGENSTYGNYGILGYDNYGIFGYSSSGYAGFFQGNVKVNGNLTIEGIITGESDPTVRADVKDGVDWTELTGIPVGFADGIDNAANIWAQNGNNIYFNFGNVGIGTMNPVGKLDVAGSICLGGVCRTTWPAGSGTGAFTDTGMAAFYNGGDIGIGITTPKQLPNVDSRVLHILQSKSLTGDSAVGLRLEIEDNIDAGIMSAHRSGGDSGLFIGTLNNYHVGFGTNSIEKVRIDIDGNLGIGTQTPLQKLHVQGSAYIYDKLSIGNANAVNNLHVNGSSTLFSSDASDFKFYISKHSNNDSASLIFQNSFQGHTEMGLIGDNNFHIKVSPDGETFKDVLYIDATWGLVGIGTMAPDVGKLNVISTELNTTALYAESMGDNSHAFYARKDGAGTAVLIRKMAGEAGYALEINHGGIDPAVLIRSGTSPLMIVDSAGKVGIGTITPQGTLDVNGSIYQRGNLLHADYVFSPTYVLESIEEHSIFMWKNHHLKGIPKMQIDKDGREIIEIGSHQRGIVEELEKAHIYIEQLYNQNNQLQEQIKMLEEKLTILENR